MVSIWQMVILFLAYFNLWYQFLRLGALIESDLPKLRNVLQLAVDQINQDRQLLPNVDLRINYYNISDTEPFKTQQQGIVYVQFCRYIVIATKGLIILLLYQYFSTTVISNSISNFLSRHY